MKNKNLWIAICLVISQITLKAQTWNLVPFDPGTTVQNVLDSLYGSNQVFQLDCENLWGIDPENDILNLNIIFPDSTTQVTLNATANSVGSYTFSGFTNTDPIAFADLNVNQSILNLAISDPYKTINYTSIEDYYEEDPCKRVIVVWEDEPIDPDVATIDCETVVLRLGLEVAYDIYADYFAHYSPLGKTQDEIINIILSEAIDMLNQAANFYSGVFGKTVLIIPAYEIVHTSPDGLCGQLSTEGGSNDVFSGMQQLASLNHIYKCYKANSGLLFVKNCTDYPGETKPGKGFCAKADKTVSAGGIADLPVGYVALSGFPYFQYGRYINNRLQIYFQGQALLHELGHMFGANETELTACDDECPEEVMCQNGGVFWEDELTVSQCTWTSWRSRINSSCDCLLPEDAPECIPCEETYTISFDQSKVSYGCAEQSVLDVTIKVQNDCHAKEDVSLQLAWGTLQNFHVLLIDPNTPHDFQQETIRPRPNSTYLDQINVPLFDLTPGEEKEFKIRFLVNGHTNANRLNFELTKDNDITNPVTKASVSNRFVAFIPGTATLSQLIAQYNTSTAVLGKTRVFPATNPGCATTPDIVVDQELIIDVNNYCLSQSRIQFNPGAVMTIASGIHHKLHEDRLYPCSEMWGGVILEPGASLEMVYSSVEDAENGLLLENNTMAAVNYSSFIRNNVAVHAPMTSSNAYAFIGNSSIDGGGGLITPKSGLKAAAGVIMNNGTALVSEAQPNQDFGMFITNTASGVLGFNSHIYVHSGTISNIYGPAGSIPPVPAGIYDGFAIHSQGRGHILEVGTGGPVLISNADQAVYSKGHFTIVQESVIDNVDKGIEIDVTGPRRYSIKNNVITANEFGIRDYFSHIKKGTITGNDISIEQANGRGIEIRGSGGGSDVMIKDNYIGTTNDGTGISLWSSQKVDIVNNSIYQLGGGSLARGIEFMGSSRTNTTCNNIVGLGSSSGAQCIYMENGPANTLSCNDTWFSDQGIQLVDGCLSSTLSGNTMSSHGDRGLLYGRSMGVGANTGDQPFAGNTWNSASAWHFGTNQEREQSEYTVNVSSGTQFGPSNLTELIGLQWFIDDNQQSNYSCATNNTCPDGKGHITPRGGEGLDSLCVDIASGNTNLGAFATERLWNMRHQLYDLMEEGLVTDEGDSVLIQFYNDAANGNIGVLHSVHDFSPSVTSLNLVDTLTTILEGLFALDTSSILDSGQITTVDRSLFLADIASLNVQMNNHEDVQDSIWSDAVTDGLNELNGLALPNAQEEDLSDVLNIYLNYLDQGRNYLANQEAALLSIALLCPYEGGPAVYLARALLSPLDHLWYTDDCPAAFQQTTTRGGINEATLQVYPNPAQDRLMVPWQVERRAVWQIIDLSGKVIQFRCFGRRTTSAFY